MLKNLKHLLFSLATLLFFHAAMAQATKVNDDPDADFKLAKELYQKQDFSLAYPLFKMLYYNDKRSESNYPVSIKLEAKYYSIVCGLQLNDSTAGADARQFIDLEHNTPRIEMLSYQLAEYYYRQKNFVEAASYYEKAHYDNLSNAEIAQLKFHEGYCYFTMQRFDDAKSLFNSIRQITSDPNYIDANYYYGFICFYEKDYNEALAAFTIVADKPNYKNVVPYYIAEIYYFRGEKDKAISYGEAALQDNNQYYDLELRELLGHLYFERKQFAKALPYLEKYVMNTPKVSRENLYELSFCYYETKQLAKAIDGFKQLGGKEDSLAQNSMYLLADAYLKTNNKPSARSAFLFCELNSSNSAQKQVSQFNYGKLSYELGYLDVALTELQHFISTYPKSPYNTEAKELLVSVLSNTNNYKEALDLFDNLHSQSELVLRAYPKILYGRAVELINDQHLAEANDLLNKILTAQYNEAQLQPAYFWKGEIAYRNEQFDSAIDYLAMYTQNAVSYGEVNNTDAEYTLGYSYIKTQDYGSALKNFEAVAGNGTAPAQLRQDAYLRSGDCYFMEKKYPKALEIYQSIITHNLPSADYAYYQTAIIAGAYDQSSNKINILNSFASRYQSSTLIGDAAMETANTYMGNDDFKDAIPPLNNIILNKKLDALKPNAYLDLGVCYFNLNDNDNALKNFKTLISLYPNSSSSDEAISYVQTIFINRQQPQEFISFMKQNGKTVSYSQEDSLTFISSMLRYNQKDYDNALNGFANYLSKFPDGKYSIDAYYLSAGIYNNKKDFNNALTGYAAVAAKAPNKYAEDAVLQAARINYFELKDYAKAEQYYVQLKTIATDANNKLESMRGLLRCQYKLSQFTDAEQNAQDLLQQKGIASDDKMMANMVIAKNDQLNNQLDDAINVYESVIALGKSEYAAEARYHIAEILLAQNKLKAAEKAGFDVINKAGSYDYWITKAYILLGDIYYGEKDYFNAEATLKSVVQNATDATLKAEAQQKLDAVTADENQNSKVQQ